MESLLWTSGIQQWFTVPYKSAQNGLAERGFRTIFDGVRTVLAQSQVPVQLWLEALMYVNYTRNRLPHSRRPNTTPYEMLYKKKPMVSHLRTFGSRVYVHLPKVQRQYSKVGVRAEPYILVGYDEHSKGYRCLRIEDLTKISIVHDCKIDETTLGLPQVTKNQGESKGNFSLPKNDNNIAPVITKNQEEKPPSPTSGGGTRSRRAFLVSK